MPPPAIPYTEVSRLKPAPTLDTILVEDVLELEGVASNPATLRNGMLWYNTTSNALNARINGATVALGAGGGGGGSGTVTSVALSFTGGIVSVGGSPITADGTLALTIAGTSGGIPYFSSSTGWASSAALAANALVVGGGAGAAPSTVTTGTGVVTALGVNVGSSGAFVVNGGAGGTPSSITLTNGTGLPVSTGISGLGTGVATALAVNVGSAGAFVVNGGAGGTPSSITLTNGTGLPVSTGISGLGTGVATFLATPTFANLNTAVSDADLARTSGTNTFTGTQTFESIAAVGVPSTNTGVVIFYNDNSAFYGGIYTNFLTDYRDYVLPDASGDIVIHSATQTLTNKTISGASNTLTNIALTSLTSSTSTALGVGSLELGHASDTTLARVSPGVVSVEGNLVAIEVWETLSGTTPALTFTALVKHCPITLSGNTTFSASGYAQGYRSNIYITCDGTTRTLAFPSWAWIGGAPTSIAANKKMQIALMCTGSTAGSVFATYAVEP